MGFTLTKTAVQRTANAVRWVYAQPRVTVDSPPIGQSGIIYDAKITASSAINGAIRWKYTIEIGSNDMSVSPSTGGTWRPWTTGTTVYAFNQSEELNSFTSGSATIGTGNTVAQSTGVVNSGSCSLLALPVGAKVSVTYRGCDASGHNYYTIIGGMNSAQ